MRAAWSITFPVAIVVMASAMSVAAQDRPDISGTWRLNHDLTAQARAHEIEREPNIGRRLPVGASGSPMGMGGGGGRGPTDTGSGSRRSSEELAKAREGLRLASLVPDRLTIARDGKTFVVTDPAGVTQRLTPDGKTTKSEIGALTIDAKAKWEGATLVVERKFEGGVKAQERYSFTADPRRLVIVTKVEDTSAVGDRARTLHRVYDGS
jgi:hypothetical protein